MPLSLSNKSRYYGNKYAKSILKVIITKENLELIEMSDDNLYVKRLEEMNGQKVKWKDAKGEKITTYEFIRTTRRDDLEELKTLNDELK